MCSPITKDHRSAFISVLDTWELPAPRFQSSKPEATSLSYLFILVLMPATHVHRLSHTHTHTCTGCLTNTHVHRLSHTRAQADTHTCTGCHRTKSKQNLAPRFHTHTHTRAQAVTEQNPKLLWLTCSNTSVTMISCQLSLLFLPCWLQCPFPPTPVVFSSSVHKDLILQLAAQSVLSQRPALTVPHPTIQISIPKLACSFLRKCLVQSKHSINICWMNYEC